MKRREFLRQVGVGLAAGWLWSPWPFPLKVQASNNPIPNMAFLADAHLRDGDDRRAEAKALARAVAEIAAMRPRPELALFAGDLAHDGHPKALSLGKEILADLPCPVWMVMGEGDGLGEGSTHWRRLFGEPRFCRSQGGINLVGLHSFQVRATYGPAFEIGEAPRRRLAQELARLDPDAPLVVLSHAPLTPIFRPWQQWTTDAALVMPLFNRFRRVLLVHGHVHGAGVGGLVSSEQLAVSSQKPWRENHFNEIAPPYQEITENRKLKTENTFSIPATAWPLPSALQGTPAALRPGLGPTGCGWGVVAWGREGHDSLEFQPHIWQS